MSDLKKTMQKRNFNSIKVRLKLDALYNAGGTDANFNSIKVRLKRRVGPHAQVGRRDFNSIKVRLKRSKSSEPDGDIDEFQFHKGTIKTLERAN